MQTLTIGPNDANQRLDRFLKKLMPEATSSLLYKSIRKKNITVNGKKTDEKAIVQLGDEVNIYFSDETIEKFKGKARERRKAQNFPEIIYEDDNIILMNKPAGVLSHNDGKAYVPNMVDKMVDYLIATGSYSPRTEQTFRPAICNRLDRNTSGIIIGAKTAGALRSINRGLQTHAVDKHYYALVKGEVTEAFTDESALVKDSAVNRVRVQSGGKYSKTVFRPVAVSAYTLLDVELVTGRTHQIRTVLKRHDHPIVGDHKYGDPSTNGYFAKHFNYRSQFLHNFKVVFHAIEGLEYLDGRTFEVPLPDVEGKILEALFHENL
ncbi:RluA family pseudouridine synthase [Peptoniphilus equinus]|uniref:Pseudouridine synthase n=1 Tax=Peptoniphilus equinus TaxID=3016343 RepID=A0ABY7QS34_9FIRM|nr:RluA family pseudouridine synthase [Peptoniphilus equinus]WBW49572.1 RluA family pseudouridine synthase [Peptoniphilus equinus]